MVSVGYPLAELGVCNSILVQDRSEVHYLLHSFKDKVAAPQRGEEQWPGNTSLHIRHGGSDK